jgi:hypothetical protein|tara:strand:- start:6646 stop:6960 length:315 start_codon:yes stop_codon:yes gene_type:complete
MLANRLRYIAKSKINGKRRFRGIKYPTIPPKSTDLYIMTTSGDRLDLLANQFYDDIRLWWVIAAANRGVIRVDSYAIKPGLELRIPLNITTILKEFELMNRRNF